MYLRILRLSRAGRKDHAAYPGSSPRAPGTASFRASAAGRRFFPARPFPAPRARPPLPSLTLCDTFTAEGPRQQMATGGGAVTHAELAAMGRGELSALARRFEQPATGSAAALRKRLGGLALPHSYVCSITHELMADPVCDAEGNSFERAAIERWLAARGTSPITRSPMAADELVPNRAIKQVCGFPPAIPTMIPTRVLGREKLDDHPPHRHKCRQSRSGGGRRGWPTCLPFRGRTPRRLRRRQQGVSAATGRQRGGAGGHPHQQVCRSIGSFQCSVLSAEPWSTAWCVLLLLSAVLASCLVLLICVCSHSRVVMGLLLGT